MREKDLRYNELSRMLEQNTSYMSQYLNGGRPSQLTDVNVIRRLSSILGIPESEIMPSLDGLHGIFSTSTVDAPRGDRPDPTVRVISAATVGGTMTVDFIDNVPTPESLLGQSGLVAVVLPDDSLAPAYRTNDTLYFGPGLPRPGDGCLVDQLSGPPIVALFLAATSAAVMVSDGQGHGLEVPRKDVRSIMRERAVVRA